MTDSPIYRSAWRSIDQDMVDAFAALTNDRQFIHIDPVAAEKTPLGGTIAHGFLTLSLLSEMSAEALPPFEHTQYDVVMSMNYGFDRLRFLAPVRTGSRIRGAFTSKGWRERDHGAVVFTYEAIVEIEGFSRPALAADWLFLLQLAPKGCKSVE